MNVIFILWLLLTTVTCTIVVIECTFPCSQHPEHVCEVTNDHVQCKQRTKQTKWILKNTVSLPEYQGTRVEFNQSCTSAPQPKLRNAMHVSKNSTESTMEWPPQASLSDYDSYYSNCAESLYCNSQNLCAKQYNYGETCESDNQCFQGYCKENTCEIVRSRHDNKKKLNTIHIILTVVGIILFLSVLVGLYMFRRRQKRKRQTKEEIKTIQVANILQADYESAAAVTAAVANASSSPPPSRQQHELQVQLQRQLVLDTQLPKPHLPPPPPYSP